MLFLPHYLRSIPSPLCGLKNKIHISKPPGNHLISQLDSMPLMHMCVCMYIIYVHILHLNISQFIHTVASLRFLELAAQPPSIIPVLVMGNNLEAGDGRL